MKKILRSGKCHMGVCGAATGLLDYAREDLKVGDLVAMSYYDPKDKERLYDFYGITFVVDDSASPDVDPDAASSSFVMGVQSQHNRADDVYGGSLVTQNHDEWRLMKVKGHEEVVDGEKWGSVRAVEED